MRKTQTTSLSSKRDGGINAPVSVGFADEWRDCGVYGLQCTRDGRFRNANGKELEVFYHCNGMRVFACHDGTKTEYIARTLVAKAWLPDYYDGCGLKFLDGNKLNIHADNTEVCNMNEYRRWMATMQWQKKCKEYINAHGEFRDSGIDGISVARDGFCLREGILYKPHYSVKYGAGISNVNIRISDNGKRCWYLLADLVARAWLRHKYTEGCYITYRDCDKTNVSPDNLVITSKENYVRYVQRNIQTKNITIEGEIEKLENIKKQCDMSINFLKTGDFTEINKWVESYLFPKLMNVVRSSFDFGKDRCYQCVCLAIERMYLLIDTNRGTYQLEWLAEKQLRQVAKFGESARQSLPVTIQRAVSSLELDKLRDKYNKTKVCKKC